MATWNWKRMLGLSGALAMALLSGCKDSEFSQRQEVVEIAQFYGPKSEPHIATVRWQKLDSELLKSVCTHLSLRELNICGATRDGSSIFPQVAELPNLEMLNIVEVPVKDDELLALSEAKRLTSVELSRTGISGCGLQHLTKLPLKRLVIRDKQLSLEGLRAIASMTELEELELCISDIQLADLPTLASNKNLRSVTITDGHFSYREFGGLKFLMGATNLTDLHLSGTNLNDRTLKAISTLNNLQNLTIEKCVISEEGIKHLSKLENLHSVDVPTLHSLRGTIQLAETIEDKPLPRPIRS
jgi:Leucine-rich repeat (LRR) protein